MDRRQLPDYTAEELLELPYEQILRLRAAEYRRSVNHMDVPHELIAWVDLMTRRFGPTVRVWKNTIGWLEALMVVRYGEDPMQWPAAFSPDDIKRARLWSAKGKTPKGITYLDDDVTADEVGLVALPLLLAIGFIGAIAHLPVWVLAGLGITVLASALSNFWENELIDHLFRGRSYSAPSDHYIALYTAAPGETGGGTEVSGGSYARVQVAATFGNWEGTNGETTNVDSAGTGGGTQNINAITFPSPTANWGSITHIASLDASSGGNFFFYGALTTPKTVNNGDPAPSFAAGALDFALA